MLEVTGRKALDAKLMGYSKSVEMSREKKPTEKAAPGDLMIVIG